MSILTMVFCAGVGFGLAVLAVRWILQASQGTALAAQTRDLHHTHKTAVPRIGGLALVVAFVVIEGLALLFYPEDFGSVRKAGLFIACPLAMFLLGFLDDLKPLGARWKLAGQVLIAAVAYFLGFNIEQFKIPFTDTIIHLGWWGFCCTVLWLVGMTNLINLIDGIDGLAGGICLMLMLLLAYVGHVTHQFSLVASGMTGALLGFLVYNFPPAKIYMGDGGAYFLGFLIGLITLVSSQKGTVMAALVSPLFVLALPIVDTSFAILRRASQGLPIFRPDRRHIHHRLMEMGLPRRKIVIGAYVFTLFFLLMGYLTFSSRGQLLPILLGVSALVILTCAGQLNFSREWFSVGRVLGSSLDIRQEVQYALALKRWLELEASRADSVESLWADFIFLLRKLGFSYARLTLKDNEQTWQQPGRSSAWQQNRHEFQAGHAGVLELGARVACSPAEAESGAPQDPTPSIAGEKLFEVLSDLAAEGWYRAAQQWEKTHRQPVRFEASPTTSKPGLRDGLDLSGGGACLEK